MDNRTCSLRVVGHGGGLRVENRVPGGDVNPYLAVAALIAAGLHGIEQELPLPPERELSERFGVSRTTVREALRALQAQGLVVAGGPTVPLRVTHPEALSTGALSEGLGHLLRLGRVPLLDLVELRCALEGEALRRAARTRPDLEAAGFSRGIGPGVWDIHSPRVPSQEEVEQLLERALEHVPARTLWVNPDCGLKTRGYEETTASLEHLVAAARTARERVAQPAGPPLIVQHGDRG